MTELAFVALGANIGEREQQLCAAIAALDAYAGNEVLRCSPVYQTKPVGVTDQPLFLNMVVAVRTEREPDSFFACMTEIEHKLGRTRDIHWGPRTIDLDLVWFGEQTIADETLTVPHPHMYERAFVLAPLLDLIQELLPEKAELLRERLQSTADKEDIERWTTIDWRTASGHSAS